MELELVRPLSGYMNEEIILLVFVDEAMTAAFPFSQPNAKLSK